MNFDRAEIIANIIDPAREQGRKERLAQAGLIRQVAATMTELVADPHWETFQRHIQEIKEFHSQKATALEKKLSDALELDEKGKRELLIHRTWTQAMIYVNHFVFELIEKGTALESEEKISVDNQNGVS